MLHAVWSTFQQSPKPGTEPVNETTRRTTTMSIANVIRQARDLLLVKVMFRKCTIGKGFHAGLRVRIWGRDKVVIGRNFYIGRDSFIETDVIIGDNVMFGNRV